MAFMFMTDGIPIVYAGQEQYFSGNSDPVRLRPLLWDELVAKRISISVEPRTIMGIWLREDTRI